MTTNNIPPVCMHGGTFGCLDKHSLTCSNCSLYIACRKKTLSAGAKTVYVMEGPINKMTPEPKCSYGYKFGIDTDQYTQCDVCGLWGIAVVCDSTRPCVGSTIIKTGGLVDNVNRNTAEELGLAVVDANRAQINALTRLHTQQIQFGANSKQTNKANREYKAAHTNMWTAIRALVRHVGGDILEEDD